jgi:thiosulfate/3-mercaptopyruvate sulfurtransferase
MSGIFPALISTEELERRLQDPGLRLLDASWYMNGSPRDAHAEFLGGHIPGARRFDLERAAQPGAALSHTLPSEHHFSAYAGECGISPENHVVVYDAAGMSPSARAWWMFKVNGHQRVSVLNGGLEKWKREGRRLEQGPATTTPSSYRARRVQHRLVDMAAVAAAAGDGLQIIDARPADRFTGMAPEPRPGLRSGHIPGSVNLPWTRLVESKTGTFLSALELEAVFRQSGIDPLDRTICTCGSGVTACALALALEHIGNSDVAVYDGSWSEWATHNPPIDPASTKESSCSTN